MPKLESFVMGSISPELAGLLESAAMPSLDGGPINLELGHWLQSDGAKDAKLPPLATCGLWLVCGDLDASHEISQSIETPDGSFWHGIMHRREGDFWNSKYWFRRVGPHPVLKQLASTDYGDSQAFVDRCEAALASGGVEIQSCESSQWREWQLLFKHCL